MDKIFSFFTKDNNKSEELTLNMDNIPKHIGIIMDGNGRWAKKRKLPRTAGHKAGVETLREIVTECGELGVKHMTVYAFSTENWKRPDDEINALMKLLIQYLKKEFKELNEKNVVIRAIGDISKLPKECEKALSDAYEETKNNTGLNFNIALNYGGRDEIINAVKVLYEDVKEGKVKEENIDKELFSKYLYTSMIPDPDLIIRTSGEQRLSNFLVWQSAYSEFWFTDVYWPDFKKENLRKAIYDYQNRDRRFGGVK